LRSPWRAETEPFRNASIGGLESQQWVKMRNTRSEHNESASPPIATGSQTWQHVACGPAPDIRARRSFVRLMLRELDTNDTYRLPLRHRSNTQRKCEKLRVSRTSPLIPYLPTCERTSTCDAKGPETDYFHRLAVIKTSVHTAADGKVSKHAVNRRKDFKRPEGDCRRSSKSRGVTGPERGSPDRPMRRPSCRRAASSPRGRNNLSSSR